MNSLEIFSYLKQYKNFYGVYPRDKLPKIKNGTIVVNTDKSTEPGEHWVAITLCDQRPSEYFDSFGLPPLHREIIVFLNKKRTGWIYNKAILQSMNSTTCGNYCVLYASLRCRGCKFNEILTLFTTNTQLNDKVVAEIV
jgi:hypothetical protein